MLKIYRSWAPNAPELVGGVNRSLINLLETLLITGYGLQTIASLSQVDGVATATVLDGHDYMKYDIVQISGAEQSGYLGEFRVLSTTLTSFTFAVDSLTPSPATGEISSKMAPAGWTKSADDGSQLAAFQFSGGNQHHLYVDENTCEGLYDSDRIYQTAKLYIAEAVNDVNDYTNRSTHVYLKKSIYGLYKSHWIAIVSDRFIIFSTTQNTTFAGYDTHYFGEFNSLKQSDLYNTVISGHYDYEIGYNTYYHKWNRMCSYNNSSVLFGITHTIAGGFAQYLLKDYTGTEEAPFEIRKGILTQTDARWGAGTNQDKFYSDIDGFIRFNNIYVYENESIRGTLQNMYCPTALPTFVSAEQITILENIWLNGQYTTVFFISVHGGGVNWGTPSQTIIGALAIDIFGEDDD